MASTLRSLPPEIIHIIATKLPNEDILNLRLVSKDLNHNTFHHFSLEVFGTFRTDLSLKSMKDLEDLSNMRHLRGFVRNLRVQCTRAGPKQPAYTSKNPLGQGFTWNRNSAGQLTGTQPCLEMLLRLLPTKFGNCKSFFIDNQFDPKEEPGESLGPGFLTTPDALTLIFSMIAEKGLDIDDFGFRLHRGNEEFSRLNFQPTRTHKFWISWSNLQSLYIDTMDPISGGVGWIMDLLELAGSLRKLTICCYYRWGLVLIRRASLLNRLAQIKELKLQTIQLEEPTLIALLSRLKLSLRVLVLDMVQLDRGTWSSLLATIARTCPRLEEFSVAHPWTYKRGLRFIPIVFHLPSFNPLTLQVENGFIRFAMRQVGGQRQIFGVKYTGPRMEQVLTLLSKSTTVCQRPRLPLVAHSQLPVDQISKVAGQRYRVSYSYTQARFCIRFGVIATVVHKEPSGWWLAEVEGRRGWDLLWVPSSYLEDEPLPASISDHAALVESYRTF